MINRYFVKSTYSLKLFLDAGCSVNIIHADNFGSFTDELSYIEGCIVKKDDRYLMILPEDNKHLTDFEFAAICLFKIKMDKEVRIREVVNIEEIYNDLINSKYRLFVLSSYRDNLTRSETQENIKINETPTTSESTNENKSE